MIYIDRPNKEKGKGNKEKRIRKKEQGIRKKELTLCSLFVQRGSYYGQMIYTEIVLASSENC